MAIINAERGNQRAVSRLFRRMTDGAIADLVGVVPGNTRTCEGVIGALDNTPLYTRQIHIHPAGISDNIRIPIIPLRKDNRSITIGMFNPQLTPELTNVAQEIMGPWLRIAAAHADPAAHQQYEERRRQRYLHFHPGTTEEKYDEIRRKQLKTEREKRARRMNRHALRTLQPQLAASSLNDAMTIFRAQTRHADDAVHAHDAQLYPQEVQPAIPEVVARAQTPAALVSAYLSAEDPRTRFAAQRKALLTLVSADLERAGRQGADRKLEQIRNLLEMQLFEGTQKNGVDKLTFGIFDNKTNEVMMLLDEDPTESASEGHHYKKIMHGMRKIKRSGLYGFLMVGQKGRDSAISKAVFRAQKRTENGGPDDVRVSDVDDTHRMMIVVDGTDKDAERIRQLVSYILIDGANNLCDRDENGNPIRDELGNLTGTVEEVEVDDGTKKTNGSADLVGHKRIRVKFYGQEAKFEVIVKAIDRDINYYNHVGELDPNTGQYSGIAHAIFKAQKRAPTVDRIMHPDEVDPDLPRPYRRNPDGTFPPHPVLEDIVASLREYGKYEPVTTEV